MQVNLCHKDYLYVKFNLYMTYLGLTTSIVFESTFNFFKSSFPIFCTVALSPKNNYKYLKPPFSILRQEEGKKHFQN